MNDQAASRGFPLGLLFVIVTAAATLAAGLAPVLRSFGNGGADLATVSIAIGIGWFLGGILGGVMGLLQYRWFLGGCLGALAGSIVGVVAGLLSLAPAELLPRVAIAFTVGSGLVIGVALIMRRANA
jgi:hypothetical protein